MNRTRFFTHVVIVSLIFSLCACKKSAVVYSDTISAEELAKEVTEELEPSDFRSADGDWLADYVTLPEGLTDYRICFSSNGNNLNEFGIWHVKSDEIAPLEATLRTYLADSLLKNKAFYDSYIPEETPKLEDAEVRVFGNYVCYAILDQHDRDIFFRTIEEELTDPD